MTETEATYKTGEPLPECETGSVERMLEAAIEWNERMATYVEAEDPCFDEHHCRIVNSQTKLLRNILAKMRDGQEPPGKDWIRTRMRIGQCPSCDAKLVMAVRAIETTTHG